MNFISRKTNTHLASSIEMATDGHKLESEDWSLFLNICDQVNSLEEGPKEVVRTIKKRFATKHPPTIVLCLSLLESLMKNCGRRMHCSVCTKDFMSDLLKVISPKNNYSISLQNSVLSLIQTWALAFKGHSDLKEVNKTYQDLKNKGVEFPAINQDDVSQYMLSSQSCSIPPPSPPQPHSFSHPSPSRQTLSQQKIEKLRGDLLLVRQNTEMFGTLLTNINQHPSTEDPTLLEDLNSTCRSMQERVMKLIENPKLEALTGELLQTNDELNNQFVRYERYLRSCQQQTNQASAAQQTAEPAKPPKPFEPFSQSPPAYSASTSVPVENLIDFGDINDVSINTKNNTTKDDVLSEAMVDLKVKPTIDPFSPFDLQATSSTTTNNNNQMQRLMSDNEAQEMEQWLQENEGGKQASSGEFEKFLQERMAASEALPGDQGSQEKK